MPPWQRTSDPPTAAARLEEVAGDSTQDAGNSRWLMTDPKLVSLDRLGEGPADA